MNIRSEKFAPTSRLIDIPQSRRNGLLQAAQGLSVFQLEWLPYMLDWEGEG